MHSFNAGKSRPDTPNRTQKLLCNDKAKKLYW